MSRFLKFIVHIVVICTTLCVLAMVLPPFWGVTTEIIDTSNKETNLPMGSVTYAIPVDLAEIQAGTPLLVQDGEGFSRYNVVTLDQETKTATVVDPTKSNSETIPVSLGSKAPKVVITIGFVGYLLVATESIEGLIILGLAVLFLIILYVIAELWKKEPLEDEEEDEDVSYVKSKKELRQEEKERARRIKDEDKRMLQEERLRKKQEKKQRKIVKTGGFVDEVYEDELQEEEYEEPVANVQSATSEAHELLKKDIANVTETEPERRDEPAAEMVAEPQLAMEEAASSAEPETEPELETEPEEIRKLAIPVWSAAQLADQAKQEGDAPDIVKDDITKVTLFDYSDIIGGED